VFSVESEINEIKEINGIFADLFKSDFPFDENATEVKKRTDIAHISYAYDRDTISDRYMH
jgi:hypothetical protein